MEKKVYLLYQSSKGAKNLVSVFLELDLALRCRDSLRDGAREGVTFRLYCIPVNSWICWDKYINCEHIVHPELIK